MESEKISFRLDPELIEAARKLADAADVSLGVWIRRLVEKETGVDADMTRGLAHASEEVRQRVTSLGGKAKSANRRRAKRKTKEK